MEVSISVMNFGLVRAGSGAMRLQAGGGGSGCATLVSSLLKDCARKQAKDNQ